VTDSNHWGQCQGEIHFTVEQGARVTSHDAPRYPISGLKASHFYANFSGMQKIGFLGGGQLARMMILEAHQMGLEPHVLCENPTDPAAQVTSFFHSSQSQTISDFVREMDFVTFESEFVSTDELLALEQEDPQKIFPSPSLMRILQKRNTQKELLDRYQIPTSPWRFVEKQSDLEKSAMEFKNRFVLKANYGGYDGYGTFFSRSAKDLESLEKELGPNKSFIAEKTVRFERELACLLARNAAGQVITFPLVQTKQMKGRCDSVFGPVKHSKWKTLEGKFANLLKDLNYVGVLAIEMFDTGRELLVNELAPRVHNSGHYSQDALLEDQFCVHLKAGLDKSLNPSHLLAPAFVSLNLLGGKKEFQWPTEMNGIFHWYGKKETREGRKMGHINFLGKSIATLLPLALKERKRILK
jgi:5-(carboxyamino)imidazole ribonucleotide synthase